MAERTSVGRASRRTTPSSAPGTARATASQSPRKRTTRVTRSQSHEISDKEGTGVGAKGRRGGTQQGSSDGSDSAVGKSLAKGRMGRSFDQARTLQVKIPDLSTVQENSSVVYPDLPASADDNAGHSTKAGENLQQPSLQVSKSPGGVSAFSGTTARTSLSVQDSTDLDPESMLDALPDLVEAADKLLGLLMPAHFSEVSVAGVLTRLHTKGSRESRNWRRLGNTFQAQREIYGSDSYINLLSSSKILLGTKHVSELVFGPWRPDVLLQKANLAVFASNILSQPWQEQADQFIVELEENFPRSFTEALVPFDNLRPGTSALVLDTTQYALEVRTQYAILLLARASSQPDFDWDGVIQQIFFRDETLQGWGIAGLRSEDLTEEATLLVLARVGQLREASQASPDDPGAAIERLRIEFSWRRFVSQTMAWINLRSNEVETQIASRGGTKAICQGLNGEIQTRRLAKASIDDGDNKERPQLELDYQPLAEASHTAQEQYEVLSRSAPTKLNIAQFSRNSPIARGAAATLKRRMKQTLMKNAPTSGSDVQVASTAEFPVLPVNIQQEARDLAIPPSSYTPAKTQDDEWRPQATEEEEDGDDDDDELFVSQERNYDPVHSQVLALRDQREAESNKENMLEVSESQRSLLPPSGRRRLIDPQADAVRVPFDSVESSLKRPASQIEDADEDEDFQQQSLPPDAGHRRHLKPPTEYPVNKPARNQQRSRTKIRTREASRSQGPDPGQDRHLDEPAASQFDEYVAANAAAKERKAWQVKLPQIRKAWSEEETERLFDLIKEHGTSWKLLKEEDSKAGNILVSRDQVALKDKARNMKTDFLMSNRFLPINFDRIPISKPQIDRLKGVGIEYDPETGQREDAIVIDDE